MKRHALHSTFPDIYCCIVFFQINPHWISNSGLWKVALEKTDEGSAVPFPFSFSFHFISPGQCSLHTSLWLQWLLCLTVALNWSIILHYSPDFTPSGYFLYITKQYRTYDEVISAVEDFFEDQDENPSAATPMEVCGPQGWKINLIWSKFDHYIVVSLLTFQPTLVP